MPESRSISGEDAVRALERLGFRVASRHGIHVVLERNGASTTASCVVPLQLVLPAGALMGILRQADVSYDDFYGAVAANSGDSPR